MYEYDVKGLCILGLCHNGVKGFVLIGFIGALRKGVE
jgi:hypothetical protein